MDTQLATLLVGSLLFSYTVQPALSRVKRIYFREIATFPESVSLQTTWGIGIGTAGTLIFLEAVNRGWVDHPPSLTETIQQTMSFAATALVVSPVIAAIAFPTYMVALGMNLEQLRRIGLAEFLRSSWPIIVGVPTWTVVRLVVFRIAIIVGVFPVQVCTAVDQVVVTLILDVICFELIRRGVLVRPSYLPPLNVNDEQESRSRD
jgi:hypothetical protein